MLLIVLSYFFVFLINLYLKLHRASFGTADLLETTDSFSGRQHTLSTVLEQAPNLSLQ